MNFRILLGNHSWSTFEILGDLVLHLRCALEEQNHGCELEISSLSSSPVTMVFEHFQPTSIVNQFIELSKSGARLGVLFTETITGETLNQFDENQKNTFSQSDEYGNKISEKQYWKIRHDNFAKIAPYTSFIWSIVENSVEPIKKLAGHDRVFFLPFGYVESYRNVKQTPLADRDFDFCFFGRSTPHRSRIVEALAKNGFKVARTPIMLPRYMRDDLLKRTRVNLWMRMSPEWGMSSTHRAAHLLNNHLCQLNETAKPTYMDEYVVRCEPDEFLEVCAASVGNPAFYRRQDELIDRYRLEKPMAPTMEELIDASLSNG